MNGHEPHHGDADLSVIGSALADPGRARMLLALEDGRALPASVLAGEAGVSAPTASAHLNKLCAAGLVVMEPHGRYRYYRLAGPEVGQLIESVARLSPPQIVHSLREGTRSHALRLARRCYDHLAGRLGVAIVDGLIDLGYLVGGDGAIHPERIRGSRLAGGVLDDTAYQLTPAGRDHLAGLGVAVPTENALRCCVDWSEQRHHLSGPLGRDLLTAFTAAGWLQPSPNSRAIVVTDSGRSALVEYFALSWPPPHGVTRSPAA